MSNIIIEREKQIFAKLQKLYNELPYFNVYFSIIRPYS